MAARSTRINSVLLGVVLIILTWASYLLYTFITLDTDNKLIFNSAIGISVVILLIIIFRGRKKKEKGPNVAIIPIQGKLVTYLSAEAKNSSQDGTWQGQVASEDIMYLIREADADSDAKVILFLIDVPDGSLAAAEEIVEVLKKAKKPSVALIRGEAAASGFYTATGADVVFAAKNSRIGPLDIDSGDSENANGWQDDLIVTIAANRSLDIDKVRELTSQSIISGEAALNFGLVDKLGGADKLQDYLSKKIGEEVFIEW